MKRITNPSRLIILVVVCASIILNSQFLSFNSLHAQPVADNTSFLSFGAGASYYRHSGEGGLGLPAASVAYGRWIIRPLAIRIGADVALASSHLQTSTSTSGNTLFLMGTAEFMWDVNATFFHVYNKNYQYPIPFYPLFGLGLVYRPDVKVGDATDTMDIDFHAMLGFNIPYRISTYWDVFFEYKCFFFPQHFDSSTGDNFMNTFTLGLTRRWSDNPYHRRSRFESRSSKEDWFFGLGIGPNFSSFAFEHADKLGMYGIAPEIFFGRNYSEFWTVRFGLAGLTGHERYDEVNDTVGDSYVFTTLRTDLMMNLSHLMSFTRGNRFNVMPYFGMGFVWRYDDIQFDMQGDAGIMFRYYLGKYSDIYADLRYVMVHPRIGGGAGGDRSMDFLVGLPSITIGYIHNFGSSSTRYRLPIDWAQ